MKRHRLSENAEQLTKYSRAKKHKSFQPTKESFMQVKDLYNEGKHDFDKGYFQSAEKLFAAAIRPALSKPGMKELTSEDSKGLSYELLDSMYHLGLIYLNDTSYPEHHAKAAAIFQYCAGFSKKHNVSLKLDDGDLGNQQYFLNKAHLVEENFLKSIQSDTSSSNKFSLNTSTQKTNFYKSKLIKLREVSEQSLKDIGDIGVENMSLRADCVEEIYKIINSGFVNHDKDGIIQQLIKDCFKQLGKPPEECKYSIIGLGSLALGTMTPWSDLEFAILVDAASPEYKDKIPEYKEYFRNLSKLLHIKVINLGETHLRSIGIESLNNFKTDDTKDEWFWDDIMSTGFNFDGAHPHACKLPLGRQGYKGKPNYELIKTPDEMADFQKEEKIYEDKSWFDTDKHLVQALKSVCLIEGDQELLDDYREKASRAVGEDIQKERVLSILQEDLDKFSLKLGDQEEGKLLDVKKDIYRLADRIIISLSQYYSISAEQGEVSLTAWQALEKLPTYTCNNTWKTLEYNQLIEAYMILNNPKYDVFKSLEKITPLTGISPKKLPYETVQYLKQALAIATELRFNTYANKGQQENASTYELSVGHLNQEQRQQLIEKTFYIKDTSFLKHFCYIMLPLQVILKSLCDELEHDHASKVLNLYSYHYENNYYYKAIVHIRFLEYEEGINFFKLFQEELKDMREQKQMIEDNHYGMLKHSYIVLRKLGQQEDALKTLEFMITIQQDKLPKDMDELAYIDRCIGIAHRLLGDFDTAKKHLEDSLLHYQKDPGKFTIGITEIYNSLALGYCEKGDFEKGLQYIEGTKKIIKDFPENAVIFSNFITIQDNLSTILCKSGKFQESEEILLDLLKEIKERSYGNNADENIQIAVLRNNLGEVYRHKKHFDEAEKNFQLSLDILTSIYTDYKNHPNFAKVYNNIGLIYDAKGKYDEAIEKYQECLEVCSKFSHREYSYIKAGAYINLGVSYGKKGEYDEALAFYEIALGEFAFNNIDKAGIYNDIAAEYHCKGNSVEAVQFLEKAKSLLKGHENHPVTDLTNMNLNILGRNTGKISNEHFAEQHTDILPLRIYLSTQLGIVELDIIGSNNYYADNAMEFFFWDG